MGSKRSGLETDGVKRRVGDKDWMEYRREDRGMIR